MAGRTMARRRRFRQWPQDQVSTECLNASSIATPTAGNSSLHKQRHREQEAFLQPAVIPKF
jgi:hypothetical protein